MVRQHPAVTSAASAVPPRGRGGWGKRAIPSAPLPAKKVCPDRASRARSGYSDAVVRRARTDAARMSKADAVISMSMQASVTD